MIFFKDDPDELPWEVIEEREKERDRYYDIARRRLRILEWIASKFFNLRIILKDPPFHSYSIKGNMFKIKDNRWIKNCSDTNP